MQKLKRQKLPHTKPVKRTANGKCPEFCQPMLPENIHEKHHHIYDQQPFHHRCQRAQEASAATFSRGIISICHAHRLPVTMASPMPQGRDLFLTFLKQFPVRRRFTHTARERPSGRPPPHAFSLSAGRWRLVHFLPHRLFSPGTTSRFLCVPEHRIAILPLKRSTGRSHERTFPNLPSATSKMGR